MTEYFSQLFKESLQSIKIRPGSIIRGTVISIDKNIVLVDAGLKSESTIPLEEFKNLQGKLEIKVNDEIDVSLESIENGFGETILSREKAKRHESWLMLEKSYENSEKVTGIITGKVKGGFTVEIEGIRAFLPGSLVDSRPTRDISYLEGKDIEFKVIKLDKKHNNIVVSHRAVIESENNLERNYLLENLEEGIEVKGIIKNLTDYGAFVDLGGIDGLLHITDMSWKRIKHPSEIVNIGNEINVKVLKFDRDRKRVSLGLKQLNEDPWISISNYYPKGKKLTGKVTNITDYGCFVEIKEGIEGLVHISEMDWRNKNIHPSKVVSINENVKVMILDINEERRRMSLGLKQCKQNPWYKFAEIHNKNDKVDGKIKSITDFGIFIELEGGIDGLVHVSDISWNCISNELLHKYKKNDEISAVILQIDPERERISLGIKQLTEDPFNNYVSIHKKGDIVSGKILNINKIGIKIELDDKIEGCLLCTSESLNNYLKHSGQAFNIGDMVKVKYIKSDRKNRIIMLSFYIKNEENTINSVNVKKEDVKISNNAMAEAFKAAKNE